MGLDLVDIAFRVEKEFGVSLSPEEFVELSRDQDIVVGDLYDHVLKKLHLRDVGRHHFGLNYTLWTELQDVLHRIAAVPKEQVELKTPLAALFPREIRRARWQALRETSRYRLSELDYPQVVRVVGLLMAVLMVLFDQLQIWQIPGAAWLWPLLGILGLWMLIETYAKVLWMLAPLRVCFPSGMTTVKDLCRAVMATNYADICRGAETVEFPVDERCLEVWQELVEILVAALGVEPEQVTFRARLIADLGMN